MSKSNKNKQPQKPQPKKYVKGVQHVNKEELKHIDPIGDISGMGTPDKEYIEEHPVAKADRLEADQMQKDIAESRAAMQRLKDAADKVEQETIDEELKADHDAEEEHWKEMEERINKARAITDEEMKGSALEKAMPDLVEDYGKAMDDHILNDLTTGNKSRAISVERWNEAQQAERAAHEADPNNNAKAYAETYKKYFKFVGLGTDLHGLHVVEVGPAHHPALAICSNYAKSVIVEPMLSHDLVKFCGDHGVHLVDAPLENQETLREIAEVIANAGERSVVEVWLFNVLQHVIDPDQFVKNCKTIADRIRFFEPLDQPEAPHHPHTITLQDVYQWFPDVSRIYKGGSEQNFHTADCAYGVWIRPE